MKKRSRNSGKMPGHGLTDLVLALLHAVAAPRHRRQILALAPPLQLPFSATPHRRLLERLPSPSPERPAYRPMEPSDPDAFPWGHRVRPCAIHGWACPNRVASAQGPHHSSHQPRWGAGGPQNDTHHHWSKGPTPRTIGASDRAITTAFTDLTDPHRTTTAATDTSIR
jgi:hypothetical protein